MEQIWEFRGILFQGMLWSIAVAVSSLMLSVILGLIGAWGKLSSNSTANRLANMYTTVVRGVPDLVLMLLLFYGGQQTLNHIGHSTGLWGYIEIGQFTASVSTIGLIFGAYMTETFRGAIIAIPQGQREAGIACGMSKILIFRRIIFPQMLQIALPSFTNNWLVLIKTTSLVSVLGLQELTYVSKAIGLKYQSPVTFVIFAFFAYLILTMISELIFYFLNRKNRMVSRGI